MINFTANYMSEWNKKIVYAPNGCGKTTSSEKIVKLLITNNYNPLLFTRRRIESLVTTYGSNIYFGDTASLAKTNSQIQRDFNSTGGTKKYYQEKYGTYNITKLKKNSFFVAYYKITKLDEFVSFEGIRTETSIDNNYDVETAHKIDLILDYQIYTDSIRLGDYKKSDYKKPKNNKIVIDSDYFEWLERIRLLSANSEWKNCPLCGKRFKSDILLNYAIEKKLKKYFALGPDNPFSQLNGIVTKIIERYSSSMLVKEAIFGDSLVETDDIGRKLSVIHNYILLCEKNNAIIADSIASFSCCDTTLGELLGTFRKNKELIANENNNLRNKDRFVNFLIKHFKDIVSISEEVRFEQIENKLELKMLINNVPITESLYQTLSESEIKRFALVVLHAMIHYGKYDYIILDDPIDSYDDYYLLIACSYIKEILEEKKLLGWYIFTNNYDALRILSSILKCDSITFYDDPDCIFSSLPMQTLSFVSTYKEVQSASQNEVVTLFDYVKTNKAEIDPELGFITFIITLRNMNATIFNTFENVNVTSKTKKAITKNTLFATQLKSYVEHYYMHYDPNPDVNGINSHSNNIDTIYQIYNMITRFKNSITSNLSGNLGPIEKMRESLAKKPFLTLSGSKLINLICKKITIISFLKYEFEKLLITKLGTSFRFVQSDIDTIVTTKCLGHKLNKAKAINIGSGYCAKRFLDKYDKIFDKYSVLINSFDHAFELMFPPYIMTSIKDIKKFNEDIEELGREF